MIKSITVTNYLGDRLKLELARPDRSGFVVKSVTGLGPGKANINTSDITTTDGGLFNSARLPARNIVISLGFLWAPTIEDTRQKSYRYFPIKKKVTLLFETDNRIAEISGYVESNDPTIFSNDEGSDISIICPDPHFYSAGTDGIITTVFYGAEPLFEFPFCNDGIEPGSGSTTLEAPSIYLETIEDGETLPEDEPIESPASTITPLLEMSSMSKTVERSIWYTGDASVGVVITILATGAASHITISHHSAESSGSMTINTDKIASLMGSPIMAGDVIVISTVKRDKYVHFIRDGETTRILNCLDKNADWFQLARGDNTFSYSAEYGTSNLNITVTNRIVYEGV